MNHFDNDVQTINDFKDDKALKKWLSQSTNMFSMVLNDSGADVFKNASYIVKQFNTYLECRPLFIAVCKHDKDYLDDEQRLETPHYQCVVTFNDGMQFKSMLKLLRKLFPLVNDNQIGLQKVADLGKMTRYVCHRGFFDKYQYPLSEVFTNDNDLFMKYYNMVQISDQMDCVSVVKSYHYDLESIIAHVSNYNKWRSIIKDLIVDHRSKCR